jgi:hypothetical protein
LAEAGGAPETTDTLSTRRFGCMLRAIGHWFRHLSRCFHVTHWPVTDGAGSFEQRVFIAIKDAARRRRIFACGVTMKNYQKLNIDTYRLVCIVVRT